MAQAFIVVVDGDGEGFFRLFLADNVVVEVGDDFGGRGQFVCGTVAAVCLAGTVIGFEHHAAGFHAFVADIGVLAFNQVFDFLLGFAAKGAVAVFCGHGFTSAAQTDRPSESLKKVGDYNDWP